MPIPNWLVTTFWHAWQPLLGTGLILPCLALSLSLAQPRQRRIGRVLWPCGLLCLWTGIFAFFGWAVLTDPDNYTYGMGLERLALPSVLWVLGGAGGLVWLRAAIRTLRRGDPNARVAA